MGFMLLGNIVESSKDYKSKINDYSNGHSNGWSDSRSDAYNVHYSNGHINTSNTVKIMVSARVACKFVREITRYGFGLW